MSPFLLGFAACYAGTAALVIVYCWRVCARAGLRAEWMAYLLTGATWPLAFIGDGR